MNESLNDLYDYGLKIYQFDESFKFSLDSILLAEFVKLKDSKSYIIDFCTGTGVIPLILSTKNNSLIDGLEIQKEIYNIAVKNVNYNKLNEKICIKHCDVKEIKCLYNPEIADIVTCNPPYFKISATKDKNINESKAISKHEIMVDLDAIVKNATYVLKNKGSFYLVHRPERLEEIILVLNKYKLIVKNVQFIYSNLNKNAIIVLVKAVKNGNRGLKILKPLDISNMKTYQNMVGE